VAALVSCEATILAAPESERSAALIESLQSIMERRQLEHVPLDADGAARQRRWFGRRRWRHVPESFPKVDVMADVASQTARTCPQRRQR